MSSVTGLGEKKVEFDNLKASPGKFQDVIFQAFPQLRGGGEYQMTILTIHSKFKNPQVLVRSSQQHVQV